MVLCKDIMFTLNFSRNITLFCIGIVNLVRCTRTRVERQASFQRLSTERADISLTTKRKGSQHLLFYALTKGQLAIKLITYSYRFYTFSYARDGFGGCVLWRLARPPATVLNALRPLPENRRGTSRVCPL